jgi:hypothetical protein
MWTAYATLVETTIDNDGPGVKNVDIVGPAESAYRQKRNTAWLPQEQICQAPAEAW